jgi:hypothetical protein
MTAADEALLASFANATLASLAHRDHVRVAWLYLRRDPLWIALPRFCADLRRFAASAGKPNLYHETITWAYFLILQERMHDRPEPDSWEAFAAANADLLRWRPSVLERYYTAETLFSERARRAFVLPDRLDGARRATSLHPRTHA